jgi:uncharacterized repeat protein (TIGR01451 family)
MRGKRSSRSGFVAAVAFAATAVFAAQAQASIPKVEVSIQAHKEVVSTDASGKKTVALVPATDGTSGDVIVYTLRAANAGTAPAVSPRIEDPIPSGTVLVLDSVAKDGARIECSLDGGATWQPFPAKVTRNNASGAQETVPAAAESYTTLRWVLDGPLQPGDGRDVTFKVRIR